MLHLCNIVDFTCSFLFCYCLYRECCCCCFCRNKLLKKHMLTCFKYHELFLLKEKESWCPVPKCMRVIFCLCMASNVHTQFLSIHIENVPNHIFIPLTKVIKKRPSYEWVNQFSDYLQTQNVENILFISVKELNYTRTSTNELHLFFSLHIFSIFFFFYCVHKPTSSFYGKKKLSSQLFQISMTIHVWIVQMIKFVDLFDSPFSRAFHFAFANFVFCPSFLPSSHLLFDVKTNYYWSQFYDINKIIFNWMMIWNRNGNQNCTCSGEINPIYTFDVKQKWKKLHNCWHKSNENQQHKLNSTHSNGWNG